MKLTITFPEDIADQVARRADRDEFVTRAVADALSRQPQEAASATPSRWARLVERIESRNEDLGYYAETLQSDREELRQSFRFRHDPPE